MLAVYSDPNGMIQPGDSLRIRYGQERVCRWPVWVSDCGTLDIPFVGTMNIAGLTPVEAASSIQAVLVPQFFRRLDVEITKVQPAGGGEPPPR